MRFRVVLSDKGKEIYKGGNVPVMKRMLFTFDAKDLRHAENIFQAELFKRVGSASEYLYRVEKAK